MAPLGFHFRLSFFLFHLIRHYPGRFARRRRHEHDRTTELYECATFEIKKKEKRLRHRECPCETVNDSASDGRRAWSLLKSLRAHRVSIAVFFVYTHRRHQLEENVRSYGACSSKNVSKNALDGRVGKQICQPVFCAVVGRVVRSSLLVRLCVSLFVFLLFTIVISTDTFVKKHKDKRRVRAERDVRSGDVIQIKQTESGFGVTRRPFLSDAYMCVFCCALDSAQRLINNKNKTKTKTKPVAITHPNNVLFALSNIMC